MKGENPMNHQRLQVQIAMMILLIAGAFFGNSLFLSSLNADTLRVSVETETNLYASLLVDSITPHLTTDASAQTRDREGQAPQVLIPSEFLFKNDESGAYFRLLAPNGKSVYQSKEPKNSAFLSDELRQCLNAETLRQTRESGTLTVWAGRHSPFLLTEKCCVIRPIYDGALFLAAVHHSESIQALQRQRLTLLIGIDLLSLCMAVILIANLVSRYRGEIIRYATTDELTGLSNRKFFNLAFADFARTEPRKDASLFLLDIDFFKLINDNYGHAAGDHALRFLAEQIQGMVRDRGGFAGRWGGDEFIGVLYLPGGEAHQALRTLCGTIEAAKLPDGFRMTISAGVTPIFPEMTLAKLSEKADLALYQSKESGRNTASLYQCGTDGPNAAIVKAPAVEAAIVRAEKLVIPEQAAERPDLPVQEKARFRERFAGYIKDHLIKSTILGVRWMAPFVAGGGILIGLAFLFDAACVDLSAISVQLRADFGSMTSTAAVLKQIGSTTFNFMLPIFAGFMAYGIAGEDAFMAGFVGGYMTINSQSGFIGAMIAGFAAGVITNEIRQFTRRLPKFFQKISPIVVYPVLNLLFMQTVSWLLVTPVSAALGRLFTALLNTAAAENHVAAGAMSAMMMAVDMGGIVNKVAYNYGVAGIEAGNMDIMASVMIGGMVPPIGIALSVFLFRGKFSEYEWERSPGTLFMGLSFITEGALPYVFTDILRVIPSCMAGAALAGALSALFGCALPAPHGGIFVLPVMEHPLRYLFALAAGSLATAAILGLWKKGCKTDNI